METEGNFMEDWIKKWKQELSWQERWDVNGWGRKPKPKMVIDLDSIYKDGKLFGYDIYYDKKQINGVAITGNAFDALGENANPIRFKRNATNVSFAGNTDTAGKTLYVADSGVTVQEYVGQ